MQPFITVALSSSSYFPSCHINMKYICTRTVIFFITMHVSPFDTKIKK